MREMKGDSSDPAAPGKTFLYAQFALEKKALDLLVLDVSELTSYTDHFVICHGKSVRAVQAIADHIQRSMKKRGDLPIGIEGLSEGQWVLLDYGDVVVHVFFEPVRGFYDLEKLWMDAPRLALPGIEEAAGYRTADGTDFESEASED